MGAFPETLLLVQQTQDTIIKEIRNPSNNGSIWKKQTTLMEEPEAEEEEEEAINKAKATVRRRSRTRRRRRSSRSSGIEKRVSTLRSLVPNMNNNDDSNYHQAQASTVGLQHLFTTTADYILSLQARVRLMQTLLHVLSASSSNDLIWKLLL